MKFVVDRSKWRSGGDYGNITGLGETRLKNEEGFMCCLGFCAKQLGVGDDAIFNASEPYEVIFSEKKSNPIAEWRGDESGFLNSELADSAISINDRETITQRERETRLRELFKEHGHQIVFKGKAIRDRCSTSYLLSNSHTCHPND